MSSVEHLEKLIKETTRLVVTSFKTAAQTAAQTALESDWSRDESVLSVFMPCWYDPATPPNLSVIEIYYIFKINQIELSISYVMPKEMWKIIKCLLN